MKSKLTSSSGLFERRGNPWLSSREQVKDFDRKPEAEDPDYDFDHRFHHSRNAIGKPKTVKPRLEVPTAKPQPAETEDYSRKAANILHRLHRENRANKVEARENVPIRFKPCPGCRMAACAARSQCAYPTGRKDNETR